MEPHGGISTTWIERKLLEIAVNVKKWLIKHDLQWILICDITKCESLAIFSCYLLEYKQLFISTYWVRSYTGPNNLNGRRRGKVTPHGDIILK